MEIFDISKSFPKEEKYSLTNQIRRSSRAVPANISAARVKRKYPKSFVSKLLDALEEEAETEVWLDFSLDSKYFDSEKHKKLISGYNEVAKMLYSMFNSPEKFCN